MKEYIFKDRGISYRANELLPGRLTLVFIHGASGSSSAWLPYEKYFKDRYNVVTCDQRGHGNSRRYPQYADYHLDRFGDDLHALLQHLGAHRYVLVGHSFGALVMLSYLREYQHEVVGAVFLSPDFKLRRRASVNISGAFLATLPLFSFIPISLRSRGRINYDRFIGTGDWNVRRSFADLRNTGLRIYLYCIRQSYALDATDLLQNIKIPTLLIHGTRDTIFPLESSVTMARLIPRASLVTLANANHILVLNRPEEIAEAIERFAQTAFATS